MGGWGGKKRKRGRGGVAEWGGGRKGEREIQAMGWGRTEEGETGMIRWGLLNATPLVQIPPTPTNSW